LMGSFTQHDIHENRVSFRHNGSEDFISGFQFDVSDGTHVVNTLWFAIDVKPQNDTPVATTNDAKVLEGGTIVINKDTTHIDLYDADNDPSDKTDGYAEDNKLS